MEVDGLEIGFNLIEPKENLPSVLDGLAIKLSKFYSEEKVQGFIERFKAGVGIVQGIYQEGGLLGGFEFEKAEIENDLLDHNWHHLETAIEATAKIVPGFLDQHQSANYSLEEIEDVFWAILLHDIGWLRTTEDKNTYYKAAEKFFIHCQHSAARAPAIISGLTKEIKKQKGPSFNINTARQQRIRENIQATEFNLSPPTKLSPRLSQLARETLGAGDHLSYFCDPKYLTDKPEEKSRVRNLWLESQNVARANCLSTARYFNLNIVRIAKELNEDAEALGERKFEKDELTIGQIKFPKSKSLRDFLASGYLEEQLSNPLIKKGLAYIDYWYEGKNWMRTRYQKNISILRAFLDSNILTIPLE